MKCVMIDGVLLRVTRTFDETPGSDDMLAAAAHVSHLKAPGGPDEFVIRHGQKPPRSETARGKIRS